MFKPRPAQAEILTYTQGKMGIAAVPGSGKTHTLSRLAADLIIAGRLDDQQEILVVTLTNSAVQVFSRRIGGFIADAGLLPNIGYRVRTLHGLAHDIIRDRPSLVSLPERFTIIAEREATELLERSCHEWLTQNEAFMRTYANTMDENSKVSRQDWLNLVIDISRAFIRKAKDQELMPESLDALAAQCSPLPDLAEMALQIYHDYQKKLAYRSGVDFDDLIRLAFQALQVDPEFLARLQGRFPNILEDEAQDSSRLQERILETLAGPDGNWVRVGAPNQAIYETVTTASPEYLKRFLARPDVTRRDLPNSGRSTQSIITLANHLIEWTIQQHPVEALRSALALPLIEATPVGDPQPNPPDQPESIYFYKTGETPEKEIQDLVTSITRWLPQHPESTVAVLTPTNDRGEKVAEALEAQGIPCIELLGFNKPMREATSQLVAILDALANPSDTRKLAKLFRSLHEDSTANQAAFTALQKISSLEEYLNPLTGEDWLQTQASNLPIDALNALEAFRVRINRWHAATLLPIDQLILTLAQDVFTNSSDLAFCYRVAVVLGRAADLHPQEDLKWFAEELRDILRQQRGVLNTADDEVEFDPSAHKGSVVIATMHKAKGLEWDRVYLLSVNAYDFPAGQDSDSYRSEKHYVRDHLNLGSEVLAQLNHLVDPIPGASFPLMGEASYRDRLAVSAERLRLLYVAITRARKELIIMTNTGQRKNQPPALAFVELRGFWGGRK